MSPRIPDRWMNYKGMGSVVEGTPFVPFKVPLHDKICENLPEFERHTTRKIIEALPELGMVIDLTNTPNRTKYYQPYDWKSNGIDYRWIKTEGHVTPSQESLVHFCRTVRKFMNKNPTKLLGLHCTHGLNRTGYFVCAFMVLVLRIPPQEALQTFAEARGYNIERQNYINSIISHEMNFDLRQLTMENSRWSSTKNQAGTTEDVAIPMPSPEILTQQISRQFRQDQYHHHHDQRRGGDRPHQERSNQFASQNGVRQGRGGGGRYRGNQNSNRFDDDRSRHRPPHQNLSWRNPNYSN